MEGVGFDQDDFLAWLREQGSPEPLRLVCSRWAAGIVRQAPGYPIDPVHIDVFIADLLRAGAPVDVEAVRRSGAMLLKYQGAQRSGRVTFSDLEAPLTVPPVRLENLEAATALAPFQVGRPPVPLVEPRKPGVAVEHPAVDPRRRWRALVVALLVTATFAAGAVTLKSMLDAYRYRSHAVEPEHYSSYLSLEIHFPPGRGWRHLDGGDRGGPYDRFFPAVEGRSENAEILTSTFFRGADPQDPVTALTLVSVPLLGAYWNAGPRVDEVLTKLADDAARVVVEHIAVEGSRLSALTCGVIIEGRRRVRCYGSAVRGSRGTYIGAHAMFGRDRMIIAVFRNPVQSLERDEEAERIVASIRP